MVGRILILTSLALAAGACATAKPDMQAVDWNRPFQAATGTPPVLLYDLVIANPPHPAERYVNYWEEPTRFEFRPRNVIYDEEPEEGTEGGEEEVMEMGEGDGAVGGE